MSIFPGSCITGGHIRVLLREIRPVKVMPTRRAAERCHHYQRTGIRARAEYTGFLGRYRTRFELKETPEICVLLTYTGKEQELLSCVKALREGTGYPCWNLWILAGNRQKISPETLKSWAKSLSSGRECHSLPELWNRAAEECGGSYLLFLNGG